MFRDAYERVSKFTFPVVQIALTVAGKCTAGPAAFIVVNADGWIVTAAHVMTAGVGIVTSDREARAWEQQRDSIRADQTINAKERSKKLDALGKINKNAIRRGTCVWGGFQGSVTLRDVSILNEADLAVGRLDGFNANWVTEYPVFKDPNVNFRPGASLCKLGYPFCEMTPTFDEATSRFDLPQNQRVIPFFPIEGIFTRNITVTQPQGTQPFPMLFIETSSPGLRGQSGGPTFDTDGKIWAIQSQTRHLPLGFSPEVKHGGQTQKEHQFLNVGMGVHVQTVIGFLNQLGIQHTVA